MLRVTSHGQADRQKALVVSSGLARHGFTGTMLEAGDPQWLHRCLHSGSTVLALALLSGHYIRSRTCELQPIAATGSRATLMAIVIDQEFDENMESSSTLNRINSILLRQLSKKDRIKVAKL